MIDHRKVLVLAMNGPGVGAGASWFQGTSDLFFAAKDTWLQVTFSQLGLIPEMGSAVNWAHHIGPHRANDWLMLGGKATVDELHAQGLVNKIFPKEDFHAQVQAHLKELLNDRSGASMMEAKRLQNRATRDARILALFEAVNALAERFVNGEPARRMAAKAQELVGKSAKHPSWAVNAGLTVCRQEKCSPVQDLGKVVYIVCNVLVSLHCSHMTCAPPRTRKDRLPLMRSWRRV